MFYQLKYTNDLGDSIHFGGDDYKIIALEGFGDVGADMQLQRSPYRDGSTHIDSLLEERPIYINFVMMADDYSGLVAMRRKLGQVFNPKVGGTLMITHEGEDYEISCRSEHVPSFPDSGTDAVGKMQTVSVDLLAPDPYWRSTMVVEEPMSSFVGLFELPSDEYWEVGEDGDLYFEVGLEGEKRELFVEGDAAVPIEITFHGPLLNPTLRNNTTGQMIRVKRRLVKGDKLVIDTGEKSILLNGENVFHWIDIDSEFWSLQVGANEIEYFADEGMETADLEIRWQERYVAV